MSLTLWDDALGELHGQQAAGRASGCDARTAPTGRAGGLARATGRGDRLLLDRLLRPPGPVLDVGCGPGRLAAAARSAGLPSLGIDSAPAAVRLARAQRSARRGGVRLR